MWSKRAVLASCCLSMLKSSVDQKGEHSKKMLCRLPVMQECVTSQNVVKKLIISKSRTGKLVQLRGRLPCIGQCRFDPWYHMSFSSSPRSKP